MEIPNKSKGEHYNLRWNSYTNNLVQVLLEHQSQENLVDVTFCCEGQFIKAHKLVLSACSIVFQDMFKIHNVQHPMIILNGIKFNHFKHILEFIYQGEVKVLDIDLEGVLALGESLQVKGLSSIKLKQQASSEELKTTALKQFAESVTTSAPKTIASNSPLLNSAYNIPLQRKDLQTNPKLGKANQSSELKRLLPKELSQSSLTRVQTNSLDVNTDSNRNISKLKTILTDSKEASKRKRLKCSEVYQSPKSNKLENIDNECNESGSEAEKNSRPANAFMIFANEWRKKLAVEHPDDNKKAISVKLGNMWKSLSIETKESYYMAAEKLKLKQNAKQTGISSKVDDTNKKKILRRKTIDSVSHLVSVDLQEYDDDDDLQIIEINDSPTMISHSSIKKNHFNKNRNDT